MDHLKLPDAFPVHALYLGERFDLRALEHSSRLADAPLTLRAGACGCAVLFRHGVAVLFNLDAMEEAAFLTHLATMVSNPFTQPEGELSRLLVVPDQPERIDGDDIHMQAVDIPRLQLVASAFGKSVVLAHHERELAQVFELIEPLAVELKRSGRTGRGARELLRHIGGALLVQHRMVGRAEVTEKPELLWERPELERLHARLSDEFELAERHLALERKLELITRTAETALDLLHTSRSLRVEWYIVFLIVAEIGLTLYELFIRNAH